MDFLKRKLHINMSFLTGGGGGIANTTLQKSTFSRGEYFNLCTEISAGVFSNKTKIAKCHSIKTHN
jgi:hypothetical protein